jgi:hypothetical protein
MDSRLWQINGKRLTRLMRSDLPQVARGIVDAEQGIAEVHTGIVRDTAYVVLRRPGIYEVIVRGDDWAKIIPFFRNSSGKGAPVATSATPPAAIPSPQPARMMQPPPQAPVGGQQSFLEGFNHTELTQLQGLLSSQAIGGLDQRGGDFYTRVLTILEALFPDEFPTSPL